MKRSNKKLLGFAGIVGVSLITLGSTFAFQGNPGERNPNPIDEERFQEITTVFANKDYEGFKTLFEGKKMLEKVDTEEKFEKLVAIHEAKEAGDMETAKELADELGLGQRKGDREGRGQRRGMNEEKIEAIENNDYEAFKTSVGDNQLNELIDTEEKFEKLVAIHEAKEAGNMETVKELSDELGLGQKKGIRGDRKNKEGMRGNRKNNFFKNQ